MIKRATPQAARKPATPAAAHALAGEASGSNTLAIASNGTAGSPSHLELKAEELGGPKAPLGFLRLLWQVHHGLQSASKRMERDLGVTGPQRLVVRLLGDSPGMTAGELSQLLHLDPGTMSGVIQRLLRERLVRRAADPHDRRRFLLALTPQGRSLASRREGTVEERVESALSGLDVGVLSSAENALAVLASKLLES